MRAATLTLVVVSAFFVASVAWGDLAPFPGSGPRPPRPIPPTPSISKTTPGKPVSSTEHVDWKYPILDKNTQITLQTADVNVQLRKNGSTSEWVLADIDCNFELKCIQASKSAVTFVTGFPINSGQDRGEKVTRFAVAIDGKPPNWTRTEHWEPQDSASRDRTYHGYIWPATMKTGETQTVTVKYSLQLPVKANSTSFTYVLRSGAAWHGPIGHETVRIHASDGLRVQPVHESTLHSAPQADGTLVWELKNAKPAEDVQVTITLTGNGVPAPRRK